MDEKDESKNKNIENNKGILSGVLNQINSFDNKASILITVMGIIFGLSLTFLERYKDLEGCDCIKFCFKLIYILYVFSSLLSIIFSLFVIFPRINKKQKPVNVNYYIDLCGMDYKNFKENSDDFFNNEETFFNQIKSNANVCKKKHKYLRISIFCMIPTSIFMVLLIILCVCFTK